MRILSILLLIFLAACSSSSNGFKTPYFKLVKATSQEWIAGAKGSGRGTTYRFEIIARTGQKVEYRTAWIGKKGYSIQAKVPLEKMGQSVEKGDVIILECVDRRMENPESPQVTIRPAPFEYEGEALIEYVVDEEKQYFVVPQIEKLPRQDYM